MRGAILLGRPDNPHVAALRDELPRHGLEPRELDPRRFPYETSLSIRTGTGTTPSVKTDLVDLADVEVGWFSSLEDIRLAPDVAPAARPFARAAARSGLAALRQVGRFPWVNDPWRALASADKVWQGLVAMDHGMQVPPTLLTNDPEELRRFARSQKRLAVKSPSGSAGLTASKRILTQLVTLEDLKDAGSIRLAPVLAQRYVDKKTEIRATVVGSRVFAVEIHSQETAATRVDWRRYDDRTPHTQAHLPSQVARACVAVTKDCGLDYSGIDLIRTPADEYVFLEANSEPAWIWVEDKVGLPITKAIAALLARKAKRGRVSRSRLR